MKINKDLTKEEKLLLLEAIKEKQRRLRDSRAAFVPHEGQELIIKDEHQKRILICGNGFGKSAAGANEVIWAADGFNPITKKYTPVPARIIVVLDSPEKVGDTWLPELKKWRDIPDEMLSKKGKPYYTEIAWPNGSVIRFMFHLQEEMAFESIESDFVVLDEPPPRHIWIALLRSGRKKNRQPRFLMLGTPIAQSWLREYYVEWEKGNFPDTKFFKMSTHMNEANLSKGYIEQYSAHLTEREKATRLHGDFFNSDGLALAGIFDRKVHLVPDSLVKTTTSMPCVLSIDPHPNKPTTACLLGIDENGIYHYLAETSQKLEPRRFAAWLKQHWLTKYNVVDMICDNFGSGDFTGGEGFKSFIEVLNSEGIRIRPTTYDEKKDDAFLTRLQEVLYINPEGKSKLKILTSCTGLIRDIENCAWQAIKNSETYKPKLEISNRDFLACIKYALSTNLTNDPNARKIRTSYAKRSSFMGKNRSNSGRIERNWNRPSVDDDGDDW